MKEVFSIFKADFGRVVIVELSNNIVPHSHNEIQFGYWLEGAPCTGNVGGEFVAYSDTKIAVVNRYQSHRVNVIDAKNSTTLLMLYINESWFDDNFAKDGMPITFHVAQFDHSCEMARLCWDIVQAMVISNTSKMCSIDRYVLQLIGVTLQNNTEKLETKKKPIRRRMLDARLRVVLDYLNTNQTDADVIYNASRIAGVSRSRLYEIFKSDLDSSPNLMLNSFVIAQVEEHCTEVGKYVSGIAAKFGFSSGGNFSRFIRNHKGVTPTVYFKEFSS